MRIGILKAGKGDSLLLSWGDSHMLVDSGTPSTLRKNRNPLLPSLKDINFFLLTHIDFDHIGGFLSALIKANKEDLHPDLIFYGNSLDLIKYKDNDEVSFHHGSLLADLISKLEVKSEPLLAGNSIIIKELLITVLSPDIKHIKILRNQWLIAEKELHSNPRGDEFVSVSQKKINLSVENKLSESVKKSENDILNSSSIAFLAEYKNKKILMLGDAHPEIVSAQLKLLLGKQGIKKIDVDIVKISHHGSKHNTTKELLGLINCNRFIISTDGSRPYNHPDTETISKIIMNAIENKSSKVYLYFNYKHAAEFEIENESNLGVEICRIITNEIVL